MTSGKRRRRIGPERKKSEGLPTPEGWGMMNSKKMAMSWRKMWKYER